MHIATHMPKYPLELRIVFANKLRKVVVLPEEENAFIDLTEAQTTVCGG